MPAWGSWPGSPGQGLPRDQPPQPSHPAPEGADFESRALQLDREAAAILELVQTYIDAGQKYSVSLAEADKSLPKIATPEEMGVIVKFLISENAKMQCEARDLRKSLEQSQSQIDKLCSNLAEAQETGLKDPLTSLNNRRGFDASLAREIAEARRLGAALCLAMVDLDNFKKVNDDFGHPVGDEILKLFAAALRDNVGDRDDRCPLRRRGVRHHPARNRARGRQGFDRAGQARARRQRARRQRQRPADRQDHGVFRHRPAARG